MQFSAGVNLNISWILLKIKILNLLNFLSNILLKKHLSSDKLVVSAPSGLSLGGGEEFYYKSNYVVSHTNIVMGLVETIIGLVPAGGGVKNFYGDGLEQHEEKKTLILHFKSF